MNGHASVHFQIQRLASRLIHVLRFKHSLLANSHLARETFILGVTQGQCLKKKSSANLCTESNTMNVHASVHIQIQRLSSRLIHVLRFKRYLLANSHMAGEIFILGVTQGQCLKKYIFLWPIFVLNQTP
jgi:hypothetical protein